MKIKEIMGTIDCYYSNKIIQYGPTPKGVDWNSLESQIVRFEQISKVIKKEKFKITDVGCGYGKYFEFLKESYTMVEYLGIDLSEEMINQSQKLYGDFVNVTFKKMINISDILVTDYIVSSGIFNVKFNYSEVEWLNYILKTLKEFDKKSTCGFSFNMLSNYSDKEHMRNDLYYADPLFIFDYCKKNFSKKVSLLHDYGLYEFTIIVRKEIQ